ncbi:MAG: nucleotidyltransferase family protein [Pelagibacteraceae bacterium TMED246]|nr:MAG: nucleotidyltransferase family protein [Pelagibacteraceae bacterium TMED246]|tara:strand:+ start:38067 stop:38762 length:696 start_codon:yes stop_codon:yes gene_type:complete
MNKIKTVLVLCAGLGKRLRPLTDNIPKPLLRIKDTTLIENTLDLIKYLKVENIILNTFYLKEKLKHFINLKYKNLNIKIVDDGPNILDTGGGIYNMMKYSREQDFITLNPDTFWSKENVEEIKNMENIYLKNKFKNILLVVNKKKSFDTNLKGDFNLSQNLLSKGENNEYIYTGCQIINRAIFDKIEKKIFSMNEIWNLSLKNNMLSGFESKEMFNHITNLEVYKNFLKKN